MCHLPNFLSGKWKEKGREAGERNSAKEKRDPRLFRGKSLDKSGLSLFRRESSPGPPTQSQDIEDTGQARCQSSRLETRTKEFDMYASVRVWKTRTRNQRETWETGVKSGSIRDLPGGTWVKVEEVSKEVSLTQKLDLRTEKGQSESIHVETRKMVNYARGGRSQGKPWWKSAAILTCKSFVRPGYRGERPIEPSSSWFPPKFPSGLLRLDNSYIW